MTSETSWLFNTDETEEAGAGKQHTRFGEDRFREGIAAAVGKLPDYSRAEAQRIEQSKRSPAPLTFWPPWAFVRGYIFLLAKIRRRGLAVCGWLCRDVLRLDTGALLRGDLTSSLQLLVVCLACKQSVQHVFQVSPYVKIMTLRTAHQAFQHGAALTGIHVRNEEPGLAPMATCSIVLHDPPSHRCWWGSNPKLQFARPAGLVTAVS